ncbi:hypothetical protein [Cupriavidus basilensis]|uniref:hypothetical protein n=1 Tax=Cupriavidus basilensis TaxID=68895 RepID=UPI0007516FA4|nr:hypothetical protein [Cupriavidus basilensis]
MAGYTEDVAYLPGSTREGAHASHRPASVGPIGKRSAEGDARAVEALEQARAVLATHRSAIKTPRWY